MRNLFLSAVFFCGLLVIIEFSLMAQEKIEPSGVESYGQVIVEDTPLYQVNVSGRKTAGNADAGTPVTIRESWKTWYLVSVDSDESDELYWIAKSAVEIVDLSSESFPSVLGMQSDDAKKKPDVPSGTFKLKEQADFVYERGKTRYEVPYPAGTNVMVVDAEYRKANQVYFKCVPTISGKAANCYGWIAKNQLSSNFKRSELMNLSPDYSNQGSKYSTQDTIPRAPEAR